MSGSARERALRTLYELDQSPADGGDVAAGRTGRIVTGVRAELEDIDAALDAASTNWRVGRMAPVDRAILRIGLYELRHEPGTAVGTIIDEAVELAKRYSTEQSGRFVNGVLAELARRERPGEMTGAAGVGG
ncbi:MAG: transcription antitermination factor NusB [Acidimicrobiia bacterium]|nr:transcription antitermination factor NusB [Acidimicrobiia bacterium]MBT8217665.1 transcription antitermination factor NusB [Acidimicrobiia bacterium]NNF09392.1 transcription antitermination factor NusB [Acidimicrobiia bacterium]NNL69871.1 transcription antitermination factor NusB [Acidimicrobiia bacterium]